MGDVNDARSSEKRLGVMGRQFATLIRNVVSPGPPMGAQRRRGQRRKPRRLGAPCGGRWAGGPLFAVYAMASRARCRRPAARGSAGDARRFPMDRIVVGVQVASGRQEILRRAGGLATDLLAGLVTIAAWAGCAHQGLS